MRTKRLHRQGYNSGMEFPSRLAQFEKLRPAGHRLTDRLLQTSTVHMLTVSPFNKQSNVHV